MNRRALLGIKSSTSASSGGEQAARGPTYTRLPTLTANVRRPGRRPGVMTVEVGVDAGAPAVATRVTQSLPRLCAAYATVVQQSASAIAGDAPPDVERLVASLQTATNRVLGRAGARVLIGTVMVV